ncbi:crotonase/enoyl-CoA hydratase family protein [Haloglomus salinum]|uniref:crotonase/enoyl-CoA hydratase family protein n=1 Tax=Haloglomus salinum TaxID=2962673 RepID=UPI0020C9E331|nr:crotonase/enoyl-CoA hydratase family protein [Haloglomus salinum]
MGTTVQYETDGRVATLTLDRAERYNAIDESMPGELREAVERADSDPDIHVIVLTGAGEAFCSGYDLKHYAEAPRPVQGSQEMPWDPMQDYRMMKSNTEDFMSLWRCYTPVIAKVNGPAVAGGSDIALCADLIVMAEDAPIGYPPARVWGCPTTMMWVYRLGPADAKRMLFTGDLVDGTEAAEMGLVYEAVPGDDLDDRVDALARRIAGVPRNQLMMQKLAINQAYENMGLETTQMFATIFDGMTRHTPEGVAFKERCEAVGFKQAVAERDRGELFD